MVSRSANRDRIQSTLQWITDAGINGLGILPPAEKVAADYLSQATRIEDAIDAVITRRTTYAAGTGFVTGLGGVAVLPVTIPAGLSASYALAANTAAAIAHLRGYDIHAEQVRTLVLICLVGDAGEEILKTAGISIGKEFYRNLIKQIPGRVLAEINQEIGVRLVTKAGEKGVVNFVKMVPLVGGIVGGTFDSLFTNSCGQTAKKVFA